LYLLDEVVVGLNDFYLWKGLAALVWIRRPGGITPSVSLVSMPVSKGVGRYPGRALVSRLRRKHFL
jgi:hypothetical protein